jgi:hypothetical protein
MDPVNITFSSCLYYIKNRHGNDKHMNWFRDFIRVVNRFNLVIYTGKREYDFICNEIQQLDEVSQRKIKVILKPFSEFHNYKYERFWMDNNARAESKLKDITDWHLNMLWCEKTHFVRETIEKQYFDTEYYGWCDIGYFRDTLSSDAYRERIHKHWPNPNKIAILHKDKVYYGCNIPPSELDKCYNYHGRHFHLSNIDATTGIPIDLYNPRAHMLSGGFYITGRKKALWWCWRFQEILERYITNNVVIQDDQHIIAHCVFVSNTSGISWERGIIRDFCILTVNETNVDKLWFLFRDFLL